MELPRPSDGDIIRAITDSGHILCEGPVIIDYPIPGGYLFVAEDQASKRAYGFVLVYSTAESSGWREAIVDIAVVVQILIAAVGTGPAALSAPRVRAP